MRKSVDVIYNRLKAEHKKTVSKRVRLETKPSRKVIDQKSWQAWQDELNTLAGTQIGLQKAINIIKNFMDS